MPTDFTRPRLARHRRGGVVLHLHPPVRPVLITADIQAGEVLAVVDPGRDLGDAEPLKQRVLAQPADQEPTGPRLAYRLPAGTARRWR